MDILLAVLKEFFRIDTIFKKTNTASYLFLDSLYHLPAELNTYDPIY